MKKGFHGKVIYNPSGKAKEYSYWAANFYVGCSTDCSYCYCKKYPLSKFWSTTPKLKKSLIDENMALQIFMKEADRNLESLRRYGLFFNFSSDPFLKETIRLNHYAMEFCGLRGIPVKALTKQTWWIDAWELPENIAIGFTLTGMDELEPGAPSTENRIEAIKTLKSEGFKVWVSMEPIVDIDKAINILTEIWHFVDHVKIGILSGKSDYNKDQLQALIHAVDFHLGGPTIYWKDSLLKKAGYDRSELNGRSVPRHYNFWK